MPWAVTEPESSEASGPTAAAAAVFSVQQSSRAAKETETWQKQSAKTKLLVTQGILGNKKPGILFPVLNEMKKELNN